LLGFGTVTMVRTSSTTSQTTFGSIKFEWAIPI
jgi:hypothetical protein